MIENFFKKTVSIPIIIKGVETFHNFHHKYLHFSVIELVDHVIVMLSTQPYAES